MAQLADPVLGALNTNNIFAKNRMNETLAKEYFALIGIASGSEEGIKLLESCKIFSHLYQIFDLRGRDDIARLVISSLDYRT